MPCVFCQIAKKEIPSKIIFEDETLVAFRDIKPSAPVHILIVPKRHIKSITHLEGKHKDILVALIYRAKDLAREAGLTGYKLVFNVGREGGQIIDHLHLHLLGGWNQQSDIDAMPHTGIDQ